MTATDDLTRPRRPNPAGPLVTRGAVPGVLTAGAITSLGAGAIHATAAGAHSEHRAAVVVFVATAIAQLGWGAWALRRSGVAVSLLGAAINAAAVGGWLLAKTSGISFVPGLDARESPQFADTLAAALATFAVAAALVCLDRQVRRQPGTSPALSGIAAIATVALVVPGMMQAGSHAHAGTHDHDTAGATPPVPYMATLPVDLGGVPGVSEQQVAEAEALVTDTLLTLPQFADVAAIEAMGYRSIGDGRSGFEHFMNWDLVSDGRVLDPEYPESLVFAVDQATGEKTLSAAMFVANPDDTLDTVPDVGGALVQWHVHNDLCFVGQADRWRVVDVLRPGEQCAPGTFQFPGVPMVHVWIVPHECGPFAALEGVGAGQIRPGEDRLCDHAHGAPS